MVRQPVLRVVVALVAASSLAHAAAPDKAATVRVRYHDDQLDVKLDKAPVTAVMTDLAKQSGAELRGGVTNPRDLTLEFRNLPLNVAMKRLLGEQNFTLTYADGGKLKVIRLLGGPTTATSKPDAAPKLSVGEVKLDEPKPGEAGPAPWPPSEEVRQAAERLASFVRGTQPIPVSGRLAEALGATEVPFSTLAQAALRGDDPRVRALALRTTIKALRSDAEIHEAFVTTITSIDDAQIMQFLRNTAGPNAATTAAGLARHSGSPALSRKVQGVAHQLRAEAAAQAGGS